MDVNLPIIAGSISTAMFATSMLPMLVKAFQTKDLRSYSLGNLALSNLGNVIYSIYVFSLPAGPIWLLHGFNVVTSGLMLAWYLRYEWQASRFISSMRLRAVTPVLSARLADRVAVFGVLNRRHRLGLAPVLVARTNALPERPPR